METTTCTLQLKLQKLLRHELTKFLAPIQNKLIWVPKTNEEYQLQIHDDRT
jgi:hypothetical protein